MTIAAVLGYGFLISGLVENKYARKTMLLFECRKLHVGRVCIIIYRSLQCYKVI